MWSWSINNHHNMQHLKQIGWKKGKGSGFPAIF
jgi:hypothetical protein